MVKSEQIQESLAKFRSKEYVRQRLARVTELPKFLQADARTIFDLDDSKPVGSGEYWRAMQERREKMIQAYRSLHEKDLAQMLDAMAPGLSRYILKALADSDRLPYAAGHGRKPFRCKSLPRVLDGSRANFLMSILGAVAEYPADIEWIAAWAPHAWPHLYKPIGQLLAAAIDINDDKSRRVFDILIDSAKGEHEIGQMGGHIVAALLTSARVEGWEFIEKLLLAAQREEGLRQTILEFIDEGHPEVFPRFVRLILEHDLVRFSATVRAVDVWFGFLWDAMSAGKARRILQHALRFLDDPAVADQAIARAGELPAITIKPEGKKLKGKKLVESVEAVEPAYIALWSRAFVDAGGSFDPAGQMLMSANSDVRFVATHLLCQLELVGRPSKLIASQLADSDDRVASRALLHFGTRPDAEQKQMAKAVPDLFERLEKMIERAPATTTNLTPIVWPWMKLPWGKQVAAGAMLHALNDRPSTRLLPHLAHFDVNTRLLFIRRIAKTEKWDAITRQTLFSLAGDPSISVRQAAIEQLNKCAIDDAEAGRLESLLTRKASDLRRAILTLLLKQNDQAALGSADRLIQSKDGLQRSAGLELLRQLAAANRMADVCRQRAKAYEAAHADLSTDERTQISALSEPAADSATLDDCLGLIDPATRTPPLTPTRKEVQILTPAALEILRKIDGLVYENRDKPFTPVNHRGEAREPILLGNAEGQLPWVKWKEPIAEQANRFPFREILLDWFDGRRKSMHDDDGLELVRARWHLEAEPNSLFDDAPPTWLKPVNDLLRGTSDGSHGKSKKLRYPLVVEAILKWLRALHPSDSTPTFMLDILETALATVPKDKLSKTIKSQYQLGEHVVWRTDAGGLNRLLRWMCDADEFWAARDKIRFYRLLRWIDEPGEAIPRQRADFAALLNAFGAGGANEPDLYDHFLGPRDKKAGFYGRYSDLGQYSSLKPREEMLKHPALGPIVDRCRRRVLEVELARGETATCVSQIALSLRHTGGLDVLVPFLHAAEKNTFTRGYSGDSESRPVVFSHIIRATYPRESDTPEQFVQALKAAGISNDRLLELAVYAPQWAAHVERALNWSDLSDAVWWIHAHTRDRDWTIDQDLREKWKAQVALRTPLEADDLLDGAVDVAWFNRVYAAMGKKRWGELYDVAKFAASGGGHKRAQLFADAMLGKLKAAGLIERIRSKRHQDSVRALGLLPLPLGGCTKTAGSIEVSHASGIFADVAAIRLDAAGIGEAGRDHRHGEPGAHRRLSRPDSASMGNGGRILRGFGQGSGDGDGE